MKGYNEVYMYILNYFNDKSCFKEFSIEKTFNGLIINIKNDIICVKNDEIMGWHCYGDVKNLKQAEIIENDLELFLDSINTKYYSEENYNEFIYV